MRILMLGWEFPPHISGGLGTACQGIVEGLVARGAGVLFVVPRLFGDEDPRGAWLLDAGDVPVVPDGGPPAGAADELDARLQLAFVDSPLRPYQARGDYASMLRRLRRGVPRPGPGDRHAAAAARPFRGGYGPDLAAEVERYARVVAELARREEFDVVHAHDWMTFPAGLLARRVSGRPLVCHVHSTEFDRAGADADPGVVAVERAALERADRVVCVSEYTRGQLERRYGLDGGRARVVHNAHSSGAHSSGAHSRDVFSSGADAVRARDRSGPPTVLFLGRLTRQKDPETFLHAAARVAAVRPDVRFVVAGDGELLPTLRGLAVRLGLRGRVEFPGFLDRAGVERAFAGADLYVMPSVSEPFGLASLEALALDVPVIVSERSGVAEAVPSALTVAPGDVDDLARKVRAVLERPELAARLVAAGRRELAALRWERCADRLLDVYDELVRAEAWA